MPYCTECEKIAYYNFDGGPIPIFCKDHKSDFMIKVKFTQNVLDFIAGRDKAKLIGKYSSLNGQSIITFECNCGENGTKMFKSVVDVCGMTCKKCSWKIGAAKARENSIKNYGVANPMQRKDVQNKTKETNLKKYGHENPMQNKEIFEKSRATNMIKYGAEHPLQNSDVQEKIKKTNIEKYGVGCVLQNETIKEKIKKTNLETYGVECTLYNEKVHEKVKETNKLKYGAEIYSQTADRREKVSKTNLEKFGFECSLQNEDVKKKGRETSLKKFGTEYYVESEEGKQAIKDFYMKNYGVEHNSQVPEIASKMKKTSFSHKEYVLPSGKTIEIQGYEHFALNDILEQFDEDDIVTGEENVPEIWYTDANNKKHRHYVDIYLKSLNKCIEIKSQWTMEINKNIILLKQTAGKALGYIYEIWVYDKKGNRIECHK